MSSNAIVVNGVNLGGTEILVITERMKGRLEVIRTNFYDLGADLIELKEEFKQLQPAERKALGNLDGWCRLQFGFGQTFGYQLAYFKETVDNLKTSVPTELLPTNSSLTRSVHKFRKEPQKQIDIWNKAVDLAGNVVPTEDDVKNAIDKVEGEGRPKVTPPTEVPPVEPSDEEPEDTRTPEQIIEAIEENNKEYRRAAAEWDRLFKEFTENFYNVSSTSLNEEDMEMAALFIKTAYRALSQKFHPDKEGGSDEQMVKLNRVKDAFITLMKGI